MILSTFWCCWIDISVGNVIWLKVYIFDVCIWWFNEIFPHSLCVTLKLRHNLWCEIQIEVFAMEFTLIWMLSIAFQVFTKNVKNLWTFHICVSCCFSLYLHAKRKLSNIDDINRIVNSLFFSHIQFVYVFVYIFGSCHQI